MKDSTYMPYNFNFNYEYQTYKNIGIEKEMQYMARKNCFYKLRYLIRKLLNKNEKNYKNLDKFSEWEEYVKSTRLKKSCNNKDFIHYLEGRARRCNVNRNIDGNIVTPIYVVMASGALTVLLLTIQEHKTLDLILGVWLSFSAITYFIFEYLIKRNCKMNDQCFFYMDYIKIIEEQEKKT